MSEKKKKKIVHEHRPSNLHLGLFVCYSLFAIYGVIPTFFSNLQGERKLIPEIGQGV